MHFLNLNESVNVGGHRISVNDLYQLQTANEQLGQALCESFGAELVGGRIIAGVVYSESGAPSPTHFAYSGGWMVKGGKIYKVNPLASTAIVGGFSVYFNFKTLNTFPLVTYQSGGTHQVHQHHEVDITYSNTTPSGTVNVDYTTPVVIAADRISDIISESAASTAAIAALLANYNIPWTQRDGAYIAANSLLYSGMSSILSTSRLRYRKQGSVLHLHVKLDLPSPSATNFQIKFPSDIQSLITNVNIPSILARDTKDTTQPCAVTITPIAGVVPALMTFARSHANTAANTISFMATIELTA